MIGKATKKTSTKTTKKARKPVSETALQLKIQLKGSQPTIWRRFLVQSDISFSDLHDIIQVVMGWGSCHLYEFRYGSSRDNVVVLPGYDPLGGKLDAWSYREQIHEAESTLISTFLSSPKDKVSYCYDFGDSWEHTVTVEKVIDAKGSTDSLPLCLAGAMRCPPEDCGGIYGFQHLKEVLANKKDPDHKEMLEWVGSEKIDWNEFSVEDVNNRL
jgi:hypothetical protein